MVGAERLQQWLAANGDKGVGHKLGYQVHSRIKACHDVEDVLRD
jgi:hypothetical protein